MLGLFRKNFKIESFFITAKKQFSLRSRKVALRKFFLGYCAGHGRAIARAARNDGPARRDPRKKLPEQATVTEES